MVDSASHPSTGFGGARGVGGHVLPSHPLSPRRAFEHIARVVRPLVVYDPMDPWERDTARLAPELAKYRRRMRSFAERWIAPHALDVDTAPHSALGDLHPLSRDVLKAAASKGLLSDLLPRPIGTLSPRLLRHPLWMIQSLKTEELSRADGGLMLLVCAHTLGVAPVLLSGNPRLISRYLVPAFRACARGEPCVFAFAITEPSGGSDVEDSYGATTHAPGVTARRVKGGFLLRGRKCFISGGDIASYVVVLAALQGEGMESWTAFLVDSKTPGFRAVRTEMKMGMRASGATELDLDDVFVSDRDVVGGLRGGWAINRATLNMSRIPVAAMAVGFAQAATDLAIDFACTFQLGRRRLIDRQEVQTELSQMMAETSAIRAMVWQAASSWKPRQAEASAAKFYATDVARRVCEQAMDLLGNHAVLHEKRVEKAFRDVRLTQIFEGTNEINRLAVIEDEQESLLARVGANE